MGGRGERARAERGTHQHQRAREWPRSAIGVAQNPISKRSQVATSSNRIRVLRAFNTSSRNREIPRAGRGDRDGGGERDGVGEPDFISPSTHSTPFSFSLSLLQFATDGGASEFSVLPIENGSWSEGFGFGFGQWHSSPSRTDGPLVVMGSVHTTAPFFPQR